MPIEIKELLIKAIVVERNTGKTSFPIEHRMDRERLKKDILNECVHEVLKILEDKKER